MRPSSTGSGGQLYSYVVRFDTGFAPNPFWGYCTLATCKPGIRRVARHGDWVVGTGSVNNVGSGMLVFAMRVDEVLTFEEYDRDPRFQRKRPRMTGSARQRCGDNIYQRTSNREWRQRRSRHGLSQGEVGYPAVQEAGKGVVRAQVSVDLEVVDLRSGDLVTAVSSEGSGFRLDRSQGLQKTMAQTASESAKLLRQRLYE